MPKPNNPAVSLTDDLRLPPGPVNLAEHDPRSTVGFPGHGKSDAPKQMAAVAAELSELQERLFAAGRADDGAPSLLLVLQGMDTAGKGGVLRHAVGLMDPQGLQIKAFKVPTETERRHHFLWRIRRELPRPGFVGIFDRSHYEDVLVVRVNDLVPKNEWASRYEQLNKFEAEVLAGGTVVVKCFLNVSKAEQKQRLAERLADPAKYWKYNPGDITERAKWDDYQLAYSDALMRCNTEVAPWFVVPSDRKWYRNWAVAQLLVEHLRALNLGWPVADFDVAEEKRRLAAS